MIHRLAGALLLFLFVTRVAGNWTLLLNQSVYNETRSMPCSTLLDSTANPKPSAILAFDIVIPKEVHKCTELVIDLALLRTYADDTARYRAPTTTHFWLWSNIALNSRFSVQTPPLIAKHDLPLAGTQSWEYMTKHMLETTSEISTRRYVWPNLSLAPGTFWIGFSVAVERNHVTSDRTKNEVRALTTALGTPRGPGSLAYRVIDPFGNFYAVTYPGLRNWTNASAAEPLLMPQFTPGARSSGTGELAGAVYGVCQGLASGDSRVLSTLPAIYAPPGSTPVVAHIGIPTESTSPEESGVSPTPLKSAPPPVKGTVPTGTVGTISPLPPPPLPSPAVVVTVDTPPPPSAPSAQPPPLPVTPTATTTPEEHVIGTPPVSITGAGLNLNIVWGLIAGVLVLVILGIVVYILVERKNNYYLNLDSHQMVELAKTENLLTPEDDAGQQVLDSSYSDESGVAANDDLDAPVETKMMLGVPIAKKK